MIYPKDFEDLMESFKLLPGIGDKSAERFVFSINQLNDKEIEKFSSSLTFLSVKKIWAAIKPPSLIIIKL